MNRWLIAMGSVLLVAGCAVGVEDPQPAPPPEPVQKDPPARTFSGELEQEEADRIAFPGVDNIHSLPPRQKPPVPGLAPAPAQE
jgi:hypothetical protein